MKKTFLVVFAGIFIFAPPSYAALVDNGDGTVTDSGTGLMWQQAVGGQMNWEAALDYCEGLALPAVDGYNDWRLPTIKELQSIVDYGTIALAIDTDYFPNTVSSYYWSSSTNVGDTGYAWRVSFFNGHVGNGDKASTYYVRAVRGGQSRLLDHLVINSPCQADRLHVGDTQTITWEDSAEIGGYVRISLSRDGGLTFDEVIEESTDNDGEYGWTVSAPESVNCALKIEPLETGHEDKWTVQSLFTIINSGFVVTALTGTVSEDGSASFTVKLASVPTNNVTLGISSNDTGEATVSSASLTFTPANWGEAQTVTVSGIADEEDDGDQSCTIVLGAAVSADENYDGIDPADIVVSVVDVDEDSGSQEIIGGKDDDSGGGMCFIEASNVDQSRMMGYIFCMLPWICWKARTIKS